MALRAAVGGRSLLWNVSQTSPCSWTGVVCKDNRVIELHLPAIGLSGKLPLGIGNLTQLQTLSLRVNALSGTVPPDFANLGSLRNLYLHGNFFSGEIPDFLFNMQNLVRLNLANNNFTGEISPKFNNLTRLRTLYLDKNKLTGSIPDLSAVPIELFNVSFNQLNGSIPEKFSRLEASAFEGNFLCGKPLEYCNGTESGNTGKKLSGGAIAGIIIGAAILFVLIVLILIFLCRRKSKDKDSRDVAPAKHEDVEIPQEKMVEDSESASAGFSAAAKDIKSGGSKSLVFFGNAAKVFDLEDLLRASAEVLGKGTFGTAYKATLLTGMVVGVKRLKDVTASEKEFREKIEEVGKMNHEKLVPLRAYYYSRDEKLLVYDYMPVGSLSALLHGNNGAGRTPLNWETRSGIALGAARGIAYLHSHGNRSSHGNIKSSNILLSKSYEALAVMLLELLTGKAPTHSLLNEDGVDLPRWVQSVVTDEWTSEVFDLELLRDQNVEEEMVQLLQLALECTAQHPDNRPSMDVVASKIEELCHSSLQKEQGKNHDSFKDAEEGVSQQP
ncbi:Receptor-like kinase 1 [Quillaja saponaria]|uniref:Receptor-like kinase 1 n=1 Tax=Quillaja saponaria TaxID=32244 RepID=A0AAD7PQR1_QUISA|nr:Receptor-like kinase 1 [Quillaja saponaria]